MVSRHIAAAVLTSFALAGTAAAQDPDPAATPEVAVDADLRWPRSVNARPLTFPGGIAMLGIDLATPLDPPVGSAFDPLAVKLSAGYGVTDDLELDAASYGFTTSEIKGDLAFGIGYKLARDAVDGKLEVIARLQFGYNLVGGLNLTTNEAEGEPDPIQLGAQVRYRLTSKVSVVSPGGQLSIGLAEPQPVSVSLPVGLGYQVTEPLYLQFDTVFAKVAIKDDGDSVVIFADSTPVAVTGIYNIKPAFDVFGALSFDLSADEVGSTLALVLGARYYLGL